MNKTLVAVATVAALGVATLPAAQAHDGAAPFVAGAVIGAVIGTALWQPRVAYVPAPAPVVYAPAPVLYAPAPVVFARPAPVVVYSRYPHYHAWQGRREWDHGRDHGRY